MNGVDDAVEVVGVEEGVGGGAEDAAGTTFYDGFSVLRDEETVMRSSGLWHVTNAHSISPLD